MSERLDIPLVGRDKINRYNRQLILSLFKGNRTLARRDIVALTGMRQGTMQVHVESLIKEGVLVEKGLGRSKVGRRPRMLHIDPTRYMIVGGYLEPQRVQLVLADLLGNIVARQTELPTVESDRSHLLLAIGRGLIRLIEDRCRREDILGIALGVPGRVDTREQVLTETRLGPEWKGMELGRYIRNQFGCRFWLENDMRLGTLAEARWGVCSGVRNFLYVNIDREVQLGLMLDGAVYRGAEAMAGKLGHLCLDPDGQLCSCGNRGCVNTLASHSALVDFYRKLVGNDRLAITIEDIVNEARNGQTAARYVLEQAGRWLGLALANLANLLNPETIVLAGQISLAGELFLERISAMIAERTSPPINRVRVEWSQLADQAVPLGALALALDEFFALPVMETPIDVLAHRD